MNVNSMILQLKEATGLPVEPDIYTGKKTEFITFVYEDERTALYSDDEEEFVEVLLQISLFCPLTYNYFATKKKMKQKLLDLGFQIESIQSWVEETEQGTSKLRRVIFSVNYTDVDN